MKFNTILLILICIFFIQCKDEAEERLLLEKKIRLEMEIKEKILKEKKDEEKKRQEAKEKRDVLINDVKRNLEGLGVKNIDDYNIGIISFIDKPFEDIQFSFISEQVKSICLKGNCTDGEGVKIIFSRNDNGIFKDAIYQKYYKGYFKAGEFNESGYLCEDHTTPFISLHEGCYKKYSGEFKDNYKHGKGHLIEKVPSKTSLDNKDFKLYDNKHTKGFWFKDEYIGDFKKSKFEKCTELFNECKIMHSETECIDKIKKCLN